MRLTPDPGYVAGPVDVSIEVSANTNVVTDDPATKSVMLASSPVDVQFFLMPIDRNSRLDCFDVDIEAFDGHHKEDVNFEARVHPSNGAFVKIFDDPAGLDEFIGAQDDSCMTPSLIGQPPELVEADAVLVSGALAVNYQRDNQAPRQNPFIQEYDLSPQCMVAFSRDNGYFNWHTIGFPRIVNPNQIPRRKITVKKQSLFGLNLVDQIWMAPDGSAHLQVTDLQGSNRTVAAFDNLTGEKQSATACAEITGVERLDNTVVVTSKPLGPQSEICPQKVLVFGVPSCD